MMTKAEAAIVRGERKQQGLSEARQIAAPVCGHPSLELEASEGGYLTGNYHCTDCGELVVKKF
jgi:hypothetical protein